MARLFVAVWPPPALVDRLRGLDRPHVEGLRWTSEAQWHVTLRFLGDVADPAAVRGALDVAGLGALDRPAAVAGPRAGPLGGNAWVLPVSGLRTLAQAVENATAGAAPSGGRRRPFCGHLTLARGSRRAFSGLRTTLVEHAWRVDELTLVVSHLGRGGARYEVLARVPVGSDGQA